MGRSCSICTRPDAGAINAWLAEGRSARSVALELGLSDDAVQRHAQKHRPTATPPEKAKKPAAADPMGELVDALRHQALAGNPAIVHQYRLALEAQADAKHQAPPTRDLALEPEWIELRSKMLKALEPYPEARLAIAKAIE